MTEEQRIKLDEYKKKREVLDAQKIELKEKRIAASNRLEKNLHEEERVIEVAHNANIIIRNFEEEFEKATTLDRKDMTFLFFATALQCARWALQPKIDTDFNLTPRDERHDSQKDGTIEKKARKEKVEEIEHDGEGSSKYVSIKKMFLYPVPYDAMEGTQKIVIPGVSDKGKNLYGGNHHSATMGHDPIMGYIFGTMNIMTRTITFKNPKLQTCEVHLKKNTYLNPKKYSGQYVGEDIKKSVVFDHFISSIKQDTKRLPAGVARHVMHLETDKYCKDGLPIPFISAEKAQKLIDEDWNSYELWRYAQFLSKNAMTVGAQAGFSILINAIIEFLHKLAYDEKSGINKDVYSVKTQKILKISNVIASSSNIMYTVFSKDIRQLDIGGLAVTLYRIYKDDNIRRKIKKEFVYGSFYDMIME